MKIVQEDEWLIFKEGKPNPKTRVIEVWSKCSNCEMGKIKWYPQWRHYCYFPNEQEIKEGCVYSDRCLLSIAEIIARLNLKYSMKKDDKT